MGSSAITARGLGKQYRLGRRAHYAALRDSLSSAIKGPFTAARGLMSGRRQSEEGSDRETIWALRDVSFELPKGAAVGIVGRNGAGKSTLLKILTRITAPTVGYAEVRGRVGSLLEVGTGFHPELTGRENIYLSGTILGMNRRDLERRIDAIVDFAEVEKFLDTPVKRYSSGMYVRLAFSVAAHLEPDVLLVDEVLSVGDAAFQKKCLARMEHVTQQSGQTVLFVSHSMPSVASLTTTALWLDSGRVRSYGPTATVIEEYLKESLHGGEGAGVGGLQNLTPAPRTDKWLREVVFRSVTLRDQDGRATTSFFEGRPITVDVVFESTVRRRLGEILCFVSTMEGVRLTGSLQPGGNTLLEPGLYQTQLTFDPAVFRPGRYRLDLLLATVQQWQDNIEDRLYFEVEPSPEGYDDPRWYDSSMGVIRSASRWSALTTI